MFMAASLICKTIKQAIIQNYLSFNKHKSILYKPTFRHQNFYPTEEFLKKKSLKAQYKNSCFQKVSKTYATLKGGNETPV